MGLTWSFELYRRTNAPSNQLPMAQRIGSLGVSTHDVGRKLEEVSLELKPNGPVNSFKHLGPESEALLKVGKARVVFFWFTVEDSVRDADLHVSWWPKKDLHGNENIESLHLSIPALPSSPFFFEDEIGEARFLDGCVVPFVEAFNPDLMAVGVDAVSGLLPSDLNNGYPSKLGSHVGYFPPAVLARFPPTIWQKFSSFVEGPREGDRPQGKKRGSIRRLSNGGWLYSLQSWQLRKGRPLVRFLYREFGVAVELDEAKRALVD